MTTQLNGSRPLAVEMLQFTLDGGVVLPVRDDGDPARRLLDELDDCLTTLGTALADPAAARGLLAEADRMVSLTRARCRAIPAAIAVQPAAGSGRPWGRG